jgi:predicted TPR repeat methyltransferase
MSRVLAALGEIPEAIEHANKAVSIKPELFDAWVMISGLAGMLNQLDASEQAARMAVRLNPLVPSGFINLGHALSGKKDIDNAIKCYREALRLNPALEKVRYRIASLGGDTVPARAPDQYISGLFDSYAENFEAHLVQKLGYQTPSHIMDVLTSHIHIFDGQLDILDLGCGTGLCGELLHGIARKLIGVDLSPGMLQIARKKAVYNELVEQEVVEYMRDCEQLFDVITAADLLVYLGDLSELFSVAHAALANNGIFIFSVEVVGGVSEYELYGSGRYRHSLSYIRVLANIADFIVLTEKRVILREEEQVPVAGLIFVLRSERS